MPDLFDYQLSKNSSLRPLPDRVRPTTLDEIVGQTDLLKPGSILRSIIESDQLLSMIFWGPPGSGKTTLARVIAETTKAFFVSLSATSSGVKELRETIEVAKARLKYDRQRTIVFIDEIHRFNKGQQDALLAAVENGSIVLIGATTENPSFEVNNALLSRCRVFVFQALTDEEVLELLQRALLNKEKGLGNLRIEIAVESLQWLARVANGDARIALLSLELAVKTAKEVNGIYKIDTIQLKQSIQRTHLLYDQQGEEHYNIISALHKSLRGSNVNASLYWLTRMLEAGEDPLYIARRLVRFASEDVGLADPNALIQAVTVYQACHYLGMPECDVHLAQVVVYLAKAPKSNALYEAVQKVKQDVRETRNEPVPLHLRNAPTKLMKELQYGVGYQYNPDYAKQGEDVTQGYLPETIKGKTYFTE
ncbi:MAG: replication-associated recombination protein A [bacterium]